MRAYRVQNSSEYIANNIGLEQEDIRLSMLIGILHDIERFDVFPNRGGISVEKITDKVFRDFINHKTIFSSDGVTNLDFWISYIAWIFDLSFDASTKLVKERDYINLFIDYVDCTNEDVKNKMEIIRKTANEFLNNQTMV